MLDQPTWDEIIKVRRWECSMWGHDFQILQVVQHHDPVKILCGRCGKSWGIVSLKQEKEDQRADADNH